MPTQHKNWADYMPYLNFMLRPGENGLLVLPSIYSHPEFGEVNIMFVYYNPNDKCCATLEERLLADAYFLN
jgi:hypothetical protein